MKPQINTDEHRLRIQPRRNRSGFLLCLYLCLSACICGSDWPQFLGPTRNGVSTETGLLLTWPRGGPPLLWDKKVGAGFSGPVVAGERLILFHRVADDEVVECLDAVTGKERWKFAYPTRYRDDFGFDEGPRATPLVAANRVFTFGAEGRLHCLDLATGKKLWDRSVNEDYRVRKGFFGVGCSPLLEGNLVLLNVGGKEARAGIVAFDKDTGREVWKATEHEASYASPVAATIDGVRHVFFFTREGLVSLDPASGMVRFSKRWRSRMQASVNAATPIVIGDHVFVSACYDVGAILLRVRKDGLDEMWQSDEALSNHYNTSIHHADFLYGLHGRQEFGVELRCVETQTGKVRWSRERFGCASLVLVDGQVLALTEDGDLVAFEATPDAYREKARARVLSQPCRAHLTLANGRLYARDEKRLICLNLKRQ
jgi:outer membrane protein assembly factor BamB